MPQIIIAIIVICYFLAKTFWQHKKNKLSEGEFIFWTTFWVVGLGLVFSLKWLDKFVAMIGFSGSAIQVLLYLSVAVLFYFIFRIRLRLEKLDEHLTNLTEELAKSKADKK